MKGRIPGFGIIDRYVAREVLAPFGVGVALLTFALVTARLLKLIELVVNHGVGVGQVLGLIAYIMPAFLELTFPMALLLGVMMGFGRMSGDQEMIAARACGVSLYRLAVPVVGVAIVVYACSSYFAFSLRPWANQQLREQLHHLSETRTSAGLREKIFNDNFNGLMVYVDEVSKTDGSLHGVMIADQRDRKQWNTIIAKRGVLVPDEAHGRITLRLFDGAVYGVERDTDAAHVTRFGTYDVGVSDETLRFRTGDVTEYSYAELKHDIAEARAAGKPDYEAETELAGKFTIPVAAILFAILGVALGLRPARGGHSERFGVAVAQFFLYYSLMKIGESLADRGRLNAFVAMGLPDVVF
ncbi:MAG TPA: LPS export ABC transporter permease LptF, partial [Candidatus Binataceae bacterium]|nr:LPS export ABC transporter permease LptF [Candidatus Binataceae bacterium]